MEADFRHTNCFWFVFFWGVGSGHGKLPKPAHQRALEKPLGIKDQSCRVLRLSHKAMWQRT